MPAQRHKGNYGFSWGVPFILVKGVILLLKLALFKHKGARLQIFGTREQGIWKEEWIPVMEIESGFGKKGEMHIFGLPGTGRVVGLSGQAKDCVVYTQHACQNASGNAEIDHNGMIFQ